MIVLEASAAVEMCLGSKAGKTIAHEALDGDVEMVAPQLLPLEVMHALRKQLHLRRIDDAAATEAFKILCLMPIQLLSHTPMLARVWELRNNMTAYDGAYVALAEKLSAPIWSCDRKYQNTPIHSARIVFFDPAPIIVTRLQC